MTLPRLLSLFTALLLLCFGTACERAEMTDHEAAPDVEVEAEPIADGEWIALTDGATFAGWRGYQRDDVPAKWRIDDGAFYFDPEADGDGGDLITVATYDDFELELEWKIGECGNSGIFFNIVESDEYGNTYDTAPEMQVLDNTCHPDAENGPDRYAGANYALHPPDESVYVTKPAGEWNQARLVVDGNHVEHWLNGQKIVEYEMHSDDWNARVAASKFADFPGYATGERGHIGLQDHSDPVWFRNIHIRPL